MVEVSIADTGPGLSPDIRTKLFEPFLTTKVSGLGVGLSVCRVIVEAHGGQLGADDNPGGGMRQADFAAVLGVSEPAIRKWEQHGDRPLTPSTVRRIRQRYDELQAEAAKAA